MDEQVLEAELANSLPVDKPNSTNSLNAAIGATIAVVLVFLMLSRTIGAPLEEQAIEESMDGYTPIWERYMDDYNTCLLYTSPSPRDATLSRMPSSA